MSGVLSKKVKDGAFVHFIKAEKFKTNLLSLCITVPYGKENAELCSLLPRVLKRGCEKYPSIKLVSQKLENLYGAAFYSCLRKNGDGAVIYFSVEFVSDKFLNENIFSEVADFLKNIVFYPKLSNGIFDESFVESEKKNLKDSILGLLNDKKEYADHAVCELAFPDDAYSIPAGGYAENVDKITSKELYDFYKDVISKCRFDVFLSGSFDEKTAGEVIEKEFFDGFEPRAATTIKTVSTMEKELKEEKRKTERMEVSQSKLCMIFYTFSNGKQKDRYAFSVFNCIYGGSPFSKLFNNVREKLSLCYYVSSRIDAKKGTMNISSGIEGDKFDAAYGEIMNWLEKMCEGEFSEEEIASAKKYLETSINSREDSLRGSEDYYAAKIFCGEEAESPEELKCGINSVTKKEIIEAAKKVKLAAVYLLTGNEE